MTTVIKPNFMTVGEWVEANADWLDSVKERCPDCRGKGSVECDHCGSVIECQECDGDGWLYDGETAETLYDAQKKRDERLWARWYGQEVPA